MVVYAISSELKRCSNSPMFHNAKAFCVHYYIETLAFLQHVTQFKAGCAPSFNAFQMFRGNVWRKYEITRVA
jgi:hypothetical protein